MFLTSLFPGRHLRASTVSSLWSLPRLPTAVDRQDFALPAAPSLPPLCTSQFKSASEIVPGNVPGPGDPELMQSQVYRTIKHMLNRWKMPFRRRRQEI